MNETTIQRYYTLAKNKTYIQKSNTFDNYLIALLETRLDIILYRAKLCETILAARLVISHGHVRINNTIIYQKSYQVKQYDVITIHYQKNQLRYYTNYIQKSSNGLEIPLHLEVNYRLLKCVLIAKPTLNSIDYPINIDFEKIRELYK